MATIEQLSSALVKADAAGDAVAAKAFADEIRRLKSAPAPEAPTAEPSMWQQARPYVAPVIEGAGAIAGGLAGAPLGILGAAAGAGLGYAGGKEVTGRLWGDPGSTPFQVAQNIGEGALLETGGQFAGQLIGRAVPKIVKGVGSMIDFGPTARAAKIARGAAGEDTNAMIAALRAAQPDTTAGQATAGIYNPTWQALAERSAARQPGWYNKLLNEQTSANTNALAAQAGGATQTATRATREEAKNVLNEALIPTLKTELKAANIAGEIKPILDSKAQSMAAMAAKDVEDVRRFTAVQPRAIASARQDLIEQGLPVAGAQYTYKGELAKKAEEVATAAAEGSLRFGEAARFAQAASDSLAAHGLKPLTSESVVQKIVGLARNPEFAGNKDVLGALERVAVDIKQWTNNKGVIDAFALDAIRKNSVNAAIRDMYPAADVKTQKELAAGVLSKIKPVIVDAVEQAGGTGYGQYLKDYAAGAQEIAKQKLSGRALELYQKSPLDFVRLVEGNSPKEVEKILGPGSYDIAKEMSSGAMDVMTKVAADVKRATSMKDQAAAGTDALRELYRYTLVRGRLPPFLSAKITLANRAIDNIEEKLGRGTLDILTEGFKTGKKAEALLSRLPAEERYQAMSILSNPQTWIAPPATVGKAAVYGGNALNAQQESQNALNQQ